MEPALRAPGKVRPGPGTLRGVVFDLDGTLILSRHDFRRMRDEVIRLAALHGVPRERLLALETRGTSQLIAAAHQELRSADPTGEGITGFDRDVTESLDAIELEAVPRTVAREGAAELVFRLKEDGYLLGLFTRSSERFTAEVLARLGLLGYFPWIRTRSSPGPTKPSPDALGWLLKDMGIAADQALYIGDHPEDARCAQGLGVPFFGVLPDPGSPGPATAEQFQALGALCVVASLHEIPALIGEPGRKVSGR